MTLDELKAALFAADPAAVSWSPGTCCSCASSAKSTTCPPRSSPKVPHPQELHPRLPRRSAALHIDLDDLDLGPDRLLPDKVILLARPSPDRRNILGRAKPLC